MQYIEPSFENIHWFYAWLTILHKTLGGFLFLRIPWMWPNKPCTILPILFSLFIRVGQAEKNTQVKKYIMIQTQWRFISHSHSSSNKHYRWLWNPGSFHPLVPLFPGTSLPPLSHRPKEKENRGWIPALLESGMPHFLHIPLAGPLLHSHAQLQGKLGNVVWLPF